jgi:LmbE family N-acetylglucosaminyl deacetylase
MKILIIAAHPDDEILGCGGTLAKYINNEKMLITLTDGESSRNNNNEFDRNLITKDKICELLNIKHFYSANFPDNKLDTIPLLDIIQFIENKTKLFCPDLIFTHHPDCLNIDHALTYKATITCFRPQQCYKYKILSFYIPSSTDYNPKNNFNGNVYFSLSQEDIKLKIQCLEIYKNEMHLYPHSRSIKNIINLNKTWGCEITTNFAEKFELIREIVL